MKASELIQEIEYVLHVVGHDVEVTMDGGATIHELEETEDKTVFDLQ